ncbi:MAG: hypothetical protein K8H86_14645 [Ignavibacteriaceae bacterium]|nr:hypothetical protein [Ignavibacteriaceae bacterium]
MNLKQYKKYFSVTAKLIVVVSMMIHIYFSNSEGSDSFKSNEVQLSNSAIVQSAGLQLQFDKRIDNQNLLEGSSSDKFDSFIKIKIKSYSTQFDNELSVEQKYYPFLTSHFSTDT